MAEIIPCRYGVLDIICGEPATTTCPRPKGDEEWHVCEFHAQILDRVAERVKTDQRLLRKLAHLDAPWSPTGQGGM